MCFSPFFHPTVVNMNGGVQNRLLPAFPLGPINQLIWWRAGPTGKGVPEIQMAEPEGLGVACCRGGSGVWGVIAWEGLPWMPRSWLTPGVQAVPAVGLQFFMASPRSTGMVSMLQRGLCQSFYEKAKQNKTVMLALRSSPHLQIIASEI